MYLIGPSDDAVSRYALRLEIYGTTFVHLELKALYNTDIFKAL